MKFKSVASAVALALVVSACGGGGSSPPPTTGGGGGTPAPTPSPTPTPTYPLFSDLTGDQEFRSSCGGLFNLQSVIDSGGFKRFPDPPSALSHDFAAASDTWTISGQSPDGVQFSNVFTPADIVPTTIANTTAYLVTDSTGFPNRFFFGTPTIGSTLAEYSRGTALFVRPGSGTMTMSCVIGVPTELNDQPSTSVTYTEFAVIGNVFVENPGGPPKQFEISESSVTLSADPVTGLIDLDITLVGREFLSDGSLSETRTQFGDFGGESGIDGSEQNFAAPFNRKPDNSVGGAFNGWFFGPQGLEVGLGFSYFGAAGDGSIISFSGTVSGRQ